MPGRSLDQSPRVYLCAVFIDATEPSMRCTMTPADIRLHYPRRIAAPLLGAPGVQLTGEALGTTMADPQLHIRTLLNLADLFKPDMVWPMMDLTLEPGALGAPVRFDRLSPPSISGHPLKTRDDLDFVRKQDVLRDPRVQAMLTAVKQTVASLTQPMGAYVSGPFTVAGQLLGVGDAALMTIDDPEFLHEVLEVCTAAIERYAQSLVGVGAKAVVMLEPSAVMLSPRQFEQFSGPYVKRLVEHIDALTILHVCGNSNHLVEKMVDSGVDGLSLDACLDFPQLAMRVPEDVILVGNIDPVHSMVEKTPDEIAREVWSLLEGMSNYPNFVISTACDLPPETPLANVKAFMETVKAWNLRLCGAVPVAWESLLPRSLRR